MFRNGEVTFYNDGWKIVIELYALELNDIQEIHDTILDTEYGKFNWKTFQYNDDLWYSDHSKSIRVMRKNDTTQTIWFQP